MRRKILRWAGLATLGLLLISITCYQIISLSTRSRLYADTLSIPFNNVGLLLGTSKYIPSGLANPYYRFRIEAARSLLRSGKIKYLIVSGDHSDKYYNEPKQMKEDLLALGVDSTKLFLDYAGLRTFDSILRLKEVFGQTRVTVISQAFHNQRAIFLAQHEGVDAIGYNACDVGGFDGLKMLLRETLARVKVFVDFMVVGQPKYEGPKVRIP